MGGRTSLMRSGSIRLEPFAMQVSHMLLVEMKSCRSLEDSICCGTRNSFLCFVCLLVCFKIIIIHLPYSKTMEM